MEQKLLIGVLGNLGAGKTTTWNNFFGRNVHTGKNVRHITIHDQKIPVFLINGAPLERKTNLEYILPDEDPKIVLSSFLYHKDVKQNFEFFIKKGYDLYILWLNPGYSDPDDKFLFYNAGIINYLMSNGATVSVKNGKMMPEFRVNDIKNYLYAWYKTHSNLEYK
ncbi:MAG: hypothetical protein C0596_18155 [Marinilabiliales bacterium]|nr:MAG: hypothetical protein C0596_18155 [Marinilabiliales bacterium]